MKTTELKESDKITFLSNLSKRVLKCPDALAVWYRLYWPVHGPANCVQENLCVFQENHMEKTLCCTLMPGQVVRASSQAIAINGPLMKQLCFPGSRQMLIVRPHVTFTSLSSFVSSSPARHHICLCLWQSIMGVTLHLGSRPGVRYWPACMSPGTKVDPRPPLTTSTHTQHFHA